MAKTTLRQVLRYRFDNFMAKGGGSIFLSLVVVFLGIMVSVAILRGVLLITLGDTPENTPHRGFFNNLYVVFLELTDPGNMNQDIGSSLAFKVPGIIAGLAGVIILSMLIAFITTALDQMLARLKKGHSKVIEEDHTVILGWNDRVVEILRELVMANESEDRPCVVILAEKDKEEMDDFLSVQMPNTGNTRVVTRSGSVSSLVNLDIVSLSTCKSVIVLGTCSESDPVPAKSASDARVIKTLLGIMASKDEGRELNIIAEIFDQRNREIAEGIAPGEITTLNAMEVLAKIIVQTSRSIGLSLVYAEIMSFDGCEMYFYEGPWGETTFGEAQFHFPDGVPMGIRRAGGELLVNPDPGTTLGTGDEVLIVAEDDSTIEYRAEPVAHGRDLPLAGGRVEHRHERELIIGWNEKAPVILREYADYVMEGSEIDLLLNDPSDEVLATISELQEELKKLKLRVVNADPLRADVYTEIEPALYDNILALSQGAAESDSETVDSETIIIVLLLRRMLEGRPEAETTSLITELMDSSNQELVARAGVHDFIISNRLVSSLLAQISEEADMKAVYDDLFEEDGSEIYLKPARLYFEALPAAYTFADMMRIAQKRKEVCIGVKIKANEHDLRANFGVKLIPGKNERFDLQPEDSLIVLAEDDT